MRKREKRRKKKGWLVVISGCALVTFSVSLPWAFRRIEARIPMRVKDLHISGITDLKPIDVTNLLSVRQGDSLYGNWGKKSVEKLKENPRVGNATVVRSMTGEVMVNIGERKTAALLNLDRLYYIDRLGNTLGPADMGSIEKFDWVVFTGPWGGKKNSGTFQERIREGLQLKDILISSGSKEKEISEIHWDDSKGWEVFRVGLPVGIWFGKADFQKKAARLRHVLTDLKGKEGDLKEIDLNFDDRVVVKVSGAS